MAQEAKKAGLQFVVKDNPPAGKVQLYYIGLGSIIWLAHLGTIILLLTEVMPFNIWSGLFIVYTLFMALGLGTTASRGQ